MNLPQAIIKCQCHINECKEKGKVCWESDRGQHVHIRVDGCIEYLKDSKKADCLILYFSHENEAYAFIIEVKTRHYDLYEVKEKIQNTFKILDILDHNERLIVVPIVYAKSHRVRWKRYAFLIKLRYRGRKVLMTFLRYCESIQKAIS